MDNSSQIDPLNVLRNGLIIFVIIVRNIDLNESFILYP